MDTRKLIYDTFLKPFEKKQYGNVGVELEFPLVNLSKAPVDEAVSKGVFDYFLQRGFKVELEENGQPLFITNSDGDCLSYDNSYNNFEFAMNYGDNLCRIAERFFPLLEEVQAYFKRCGHSLVGIGSNPYKKYADKNHVNFSTYNMVDEYLTTFGKNSPYPDFPAFLSSAQTHLDIPLSDLPYAYTLFGRLDFVRGLILSNSPDFEREGYICYRDYLWEQSAFSLCPNITGKVDGEFKTQHDLVDYIMSKGMFNRIRNGKYEIFEPVGIEEYFAREDAREEDIECYLSFKNVEITRRGTLEIRSDCAQPFPDSFAPAAFSLGILYNMNKVERLLDSFFKEEGIEDANTYLREKTTKGEFIASKNSLNELISKILEYSEEGLLKRGKGEEKLLSPLYRRCMLLSCPGRVAYRYSDDDIVTMYGYY
ncbi:MAG: hypothetical protein IJ435_04165 [Clostridia bacterium]|nr:hypothetical protein [Clostridia bacterium]